MNTTPAYPPSSPSVRWTLRSAVALPATLLLAGITQAQVAPSAPPPEQAEPVTLNPFTVTSERDEGYQAQSTLAGSRLSTPLKDVGAAISIYTKDFMTDIGATNANDLLVFATGMEASGSQANFSGTNASIGEAQVVGDGPRTDPQSGSRSRGLGAPTYTRNYFATNISVDGYNTASVTVNRGPNAILFGVGSPSGVVDNALITADLNRNRHKVEFRLADTGGTRTVIDFNRVLIPKQLALRVAAVDDQENYKQKPAYENKARIFGTATYMPFRSTTISANFEKGQTRANRPITVLPFDSINSYWLETRQTYDWALFDDPARNPAAASQNAATRPANLPYPIGQAQIFGAIIVPYDNTGGNTGPGLAFRSTTPNNGSLTAPTANAVRNSLFHPLVNQDRAADTIAFYETFNIGEGGLSSALFPGGVRPAGLKMQGFTNYDVFPFHKRQIDETSFQSEDFSTFNFSVAQTGWRDRGGNDRLGIELVYNAEEYERYANNAFFAQGNGNHIRIDPNVRLPDGRLNPNVGRPYVAGAAAAQLNYFEVERENVRATAFYRHDFRDMFPEAGKWLGRHTLTGLYEEYRVKDTPTNSTRLRMFGETAEAIGSAPTNFNRLPNAFVYLGPSILDGSDLRLEPIRIQPLTGGITVPTTWFKAPLGLVNGQLTQGDIVTTDSTIEEGINGFQPRYELIKSKAIVLQSYWLQDHVVTTVGWRNDKDYLLRFPTRNYTTDPTRTRIFLREVDFPSTPPFNAGGNTRSLSVVLRWPQRLLRLPDGMDASVFYNESDNFTPDAGRITAENVPIAPPRGDTEEYGISVSLFHDKLNLRLNRYETNQVNASRGGTYGNAINNFWRQLAGFWNGQVNSTPQFDRIADVERLLNIFPETKALLNFQRVVNPATGAVSSTENVLPTFSDTQDFVSKGTEIEIVYNPTRQWRIALNAANQETTLSNLAPGARSAIEKLIPFWNEFKDTPRAASDQWGGPGVPFPSTNAEHLGTLVQRDVLIPYATLLAQEGAVSSEQRKWRVNLVTNYQFGRSGPLKGFSVGTGIRWQSKYALGYPTDFNPDGSVFVDIENPYWSGSDTNVDAWVGYNRKIFNDRVNWRVQLNVRNLVGSGDPIAITVQPDGSPATTRLPPEKRVYLTNTFEF